MPLKIKEKIRVTKIKSGVSKVGGGVKRVISKVRSRKKSEVSADFPLIEGKMLNRLFAALSYLHILVLIPLIFGRKNSLVKRHVRNGICVLAIWVIALLLFWVPLLAWIAATIALIFSVLGIVLTVSGSDKGMPLIGKCAEALPV